MNMYMIEIDTTGNGNWISIQQLHSAVEAIQTARCMAERELSTRVVSDYTSMVIWSSYRDGDHDPVIVPTINQRPDDPCHRCAY